MSLTDPVMGTCQNCGREYNASRLKACPACGQAAGTGSPRTAPAAATPAVSTTPTPVTPARGSARPSLATRDAASKVASLGSIVVGIAYFVGIVGSIGGALIALIALGGPDATKVAGLIYGVFIVGVSLAQAAFLALIGRYAQMRAGQTFDSA